VNASDRGTGRNIEGEDGEGAAGGLRWYLARSLRHAILRRIDGLERWILRIPKTPVDPHDGRPPTPNDVPMERGPPAARAELESMLKGLLDHAMDQSQSQSEGAFFRSVLSALVPDEALILSALSDGVRHPMLCVAAGSRLGPAYRLVAENISGIGRTAGVQWSDMTPTYLRRLRGWGLVDVGPEDTAQLANYQILETDDGVSRAVQLIKQGKGERAVILRQTIRLSAAGHALWVACHPPR
jgi:hypothetical protein